MAETAQTMTEFTYAPGEKNIVGDRFSPSVIIFWLKTSIAASSTRVQYKAPNTLFGLIPLGASTKTIPLRNIASVDTNTKFNLGSLVWGLFFLFVGFGSPASRRRPRRSPSKPSRASDIVQKPKRRQGREIQIGPVFSSNTIKAITQKHCKVVFMQTWHYRCQNS